MNEDGHTSSIRDKILTITVKKGWKPGTRITFPREGDQGPNNVPGTMMLFFVLSFIHFPLLAIRMWCAGHYDFNNTQITQL